MRKSALILIALPCLLCACSKTFPVRGTISKSGEKFLGTATSQMVGKSSINITTNKGTQCSGEYDAPIVMNPSEGSTGNGGFQCSDGRSGQFSFAGDIVSGDGFGTMNNGDKFDFYYGNVRTVQVR